LAVTSSFGVSLLQAIRTVTKRKGIKNFISNLILSLEDMVKCFLNLMPYILQ
jgi:hypothetical protein